MAFTIILYLIGCILSYLLYRDDWTYTFNEWTVGDRRRAIAVSIFSWLTVIIGLSYYVDNHCKFNFRKDNNKPSKW